MKKKRKQQFIILLMIAIGVSGLFILHLWAKSQIKGFLGEVLPEHIEIQYQHLDVNLFTAQLVVHQPILTAYNEAHKPYTYIQAAHLTINHISYWQYLVKKSMKIGDIIIQDPHITIYKDRKPKKKIKKDKKPLFSANFKNICVDQLAIKNGMFYMIKNAKDSIVASLQNIALTLKENTVDPRTIKNTIPFSYKTYTLAFESCFLNLSPYETLRTDSLNITQDKLTIKQLLLQSKYEKEDLSKVLRKERDYICVSIPEIQVHGVHHDFRNNRLFIGAARGNIRYPVAELYRDKRIEDDRRPKPMYGQMLREMSIDIHFPLCYVEEGYLGYEERIATPARKAGRIFFNHINAEIIRLSNTYREGEKTVIDINALFMGKTQTHLKWSFDKNQKEDPFTVSGSFKNFEAESINSFLEPNMGVRTRGSVDQTYFKIAGNKNRATGDIKMKYQDFEFMILSKNRLGINKALTAIGNLFVSDGDKSDAEGFRYGTIEADRDISKSFFNYLWINLRNGLKNTVVGNGKKKK